MSDKNYYMAYILNESNALGTRLIRIAFEYKYLEYPGEPKVQKELKAYFKSRWPNDEPLVIEEADFMTFLPYKEA